MAPSGLRAAKQAQGLSVMRARLAAMRFRDRGPGKDEGLEAGVDNGRVLSQTEGRGAGGGVAVERLSDRGRRFW
jgi:hypothetical protein